MGSLLVGIQMAIAAFDYLDIDASHKYHDFAGLQGWFLILTKLIVLGIFVYKMS